MFKKLVSTSFKMKKSVPNLKYLPELGILFTKCGPQINGTHMLSSRKKHANECNQIKIKIILNNEKSSTFIKTTRFE